MNVGITEAICKKLRYYMLK